MSFYRKMWQFTYSLMIASVLAADYGYLEQPNSMDNHGVSPFPINYDIYNRRLMINDANLIYNFEQTRRDQPPQVEQREENIGKYMYRRPKSNTVTPILSKLHPITQETQTLPGLSNFNPVQRYNQWNGVHLYPSTIPPPPSTPKWTDLSNILEEQARLRHNIQPLHKIYQTPPKKQFENPSFLAPYQKPTDISLPKFLTQEIDVSQSTPAQSSIPPLHIAESIPRALPNMNEELVHDRAMPVLPDAPKLPINRGSHKFGWDDVVTPRVTSTTPSNNVGQQNREAPPPVPKLSPWFDGFRK